MGLPPQTLSLGFRTWNPFFLCHFARLRRQRRRSAQSRPVFSLQFWPISSSAASFGAVTTSRSFPCRTPCLIELGSKWQRKAYFVFLFSSYFLSFLELGSKWQRKAYFVFLFFFFFFVPCLLESASKWQRRDVFLNKFEPLTPIIQDFLKF